MKVLVYARYSCANDEVSESIDLQVQNCKKLAQKKKLKVVGIYKDEDASGEAYPLGAEAVARVDRAFAEWAQDLFANSEPRVGLSLLLQNLKEVDYIIVNDMSRLYCPITGSFLEGYINQCLKENNVKILEVKGSTIDLEEVDPQLIRMLKSQIRIEDSQRKSQNSINAFRLKRDSGRLCGDAKMHGIRNVGNGKLEVLPEWVEIIRYIYDNICAKRPYRAIIKDCNERWGHIVFFYESSIYRIARQPIYCGHQYNSDGVLIKNVQMTGQEFITLEQWQEVQDIFAAKRAVYHKRSHKHWLPLSGRIHCGVCGSRLICLMEHNKVYYVCNKRSLDRNHTSCRNSRVRFESGITGQHALFDTLFPIFTIALFERHRRSIVMAKDFKKLDKYSIELKALSDAENQLSKDLDSGKISDKEQRKALRINSNRRKIIMKRVLEIKNSNYNDNTIEVYQSEALTKLFNKLLLKYIDNETYESLIEDAQITIVSYAEEIEFKTLLGSFIIPRFYIRTRKWMPTWSMTLKNKNPKDKSFNANSQVTITYNTGTEAVIADFDNIKIVSQ